MVKNSDIMDLWQAIEKLRLQQAKMGEFLKLAFPEKDMTSKEIGEYARKKWKSPELVIAISPTP